MGLAHGMGEYMPQYYSLPDAHGGNTVFMLSTQQVTRFVAAVYLDRYINISCLTTAPRIATSAARATVRDFISDAATTDVLPSTVH
mgnify:CR=1 FL=1